MLSRHGASSQGWQQTSSFPPRDPTAMHCAPLDACSQHTSPNLVEQSAAGTGFQEASKHGWKL